jgi:hypothetical protein
MRTKKNVILLIFNHSMGIVNNLYLVNKANTEVSSSIPSIFLNGSSTSAFVALAPNIVPISRTIEGEVKFFLFCYYKLGKI